MMKCGPLIIDIGETELNAEDREIIQHPLIGGIILFARNFENPYQLKALCESIRAIKKTPFLITVDQEGGRVQRFKKGFTAIPSMRTIGKIYDKNSAKGIELSYLCGWIIAYELISCNIDLSYAPVIDLDKDNHTVIGDRSFHEDVNILATLTKTFSNGMAAAGMSAIGKHFPGHGSVTVDSHKTLPVDERGWEDIKNNDLRPFIELIDFGLKGMMTAHILFPHIDKHPVSFSRYWITEILKKQLNFKGVIFSDDLTMEGAAVVGGFPERAEAALQAGVDFTLICNQRNAVIKTVDSLHKERYFLDDQKIKFIQAQKLKFDHQILKENLTKFNELSLLA